MPSRWLDRSAATIRAYATCARCGRRVGRVTNSDLGVTVYIEPDQLPATAALNDPAAPNIYEAHYTGWHVHDLLERRGYPLHHEHRCT